MNIQNLLLQYIYQACISIHIESFFHLITIHSSTHQKFGNYQVNGLILIAKKLNILTEQLAKKLIKYCNLNKVAEKVVFEHPGFINIFLKSIWIQNQINHISTSPNLKIDPIKRETIVIDYSGPNIAKEMHVGHLRSTVIGDSMARILSFLGHNVIRVNHIGDWGTQFGMIIAYMKKYKLCKSSLYHKKPFTMLENLYQKSRQEYDSDPSFAALSRKYVVKLQNKDQNCIQLWKYLVNISIYNNQKIYSRLNITLKKNDIMGESLYQPMLKNIIMDLKNKKLAVISNNATVVFLNNLYTNNNKTPFGVVIQKKDGGYLYSTTDIASIKYRCEVLHADRIIYYTDSRQKQHLIQSWEIAQKAGYITKSTSLEHHICGMLLESNGKPFKTRSGNALKLTTLLDEALVRAYNIIYNKNINFKNNKINKLALVISIGSIKYSELSKNRTTNYIFNWDNMLNFEGNTALYIQYAYTRIISIIKRFQKLHHTKIKLNKNKIYLKNKEEISLAICLIQFHETIIIVSKKGTPHILCAYLHKLSTLFSSFYENCPILKIENKQKKYSRLHLAWFTARILKKGLNLLGIKTIKYM